MKPTKTLDIMKSLKPKVKGIKKAVRKGIVKFLGKTPAGNEVKSGLKRQGKW